MKLFSCHVGAPTPSGGPNYAQRLADELGVNVIDQMIMFYIMGVVGLGNLTRLYQLKDGGGMCLLLLLVPSHNMKISNKIIIGAIFLIIFLIIVDFKMQKTSSTSGRYNLSKKQIISLEHISIKGDGGEAALKLSKYYFYIDNNERSGLKWLEESARQGNESAKYSLTEYKAQ